MLQEVFGGSFLVAVLFSKGSSALLIDGAADHILGARFLKRFVDDIPWLHVDLSASRCEGGLGSVANDVTGFGVGWGLRMLLAGL
jgi:leucyl aminopeptidase